MNPEEDRFLFLNHYGRRLARDTPYRAVKAYAARAGIRRRIYPHLFRHSKLTQLANDNVNLFKIQQFAGHLHADQTAKYVHPDAVQTRKEIQSTPMIAIESAPKQAPFQGMEQMRTSLTLSLALGEISQETYNRAMSDLESSPLEALR